MNPTPEWIIILAPFASGAAGVFITGGIAWGIMREKIADLQRRVGKAEDRLSLQVGETRCDRMRKECMDRVVVELRDVKADVRSLGERIAIVDSKFAEIALYIAGTKRNEK